MIKLIAFDLDNVLIDGEVIDEMAKLVGVEEEISKITSQAMEGDIDFGKALTERVALLKGASVEDINKVMLEIPLMEGAKESVSQLKKRGYKISSFFIYYTNLIIAISAASPRRGPIFII